jgi:hypothetical protein
MAYLARMLRAIAVVVGLVHWAAGLLGAQDPFDPRGFSRRMVQPTELASRSPPDPLDAQLDRPWEAQPDERSFDLPPGASTEWPGPAAADVATPLDERENQGLAVRDRLRIEVSNLWSDFGNYYCRPTTYCNLAIAFGAGAALANTPIDEHFEDWYESRVRSNASDHAASFFRAFGAGWIFIPAWAGIGVAGAYFDESPYGNIAADFGFQTTRALLVGAPALLFAQYATGGSRPDEAPYTSAWRPFRDSNGVSGHAYIGAVPFLTAARMVESPWLKGLFYFGSTLPGWSRINDNKHFLSQAILGWCMAYIACDAVEQTEIATASVLLTPVVSENMVGMGILVQF